MGEIKVFRVIIGFLLGIATSGCFAFTSRNDGEQLKQEVAHLSDRLEKLENSASKDRNDLSQMIDRAQSQVADMEETLARATRVLARNSADFGAEMEQLKNDVMAQKGEIATLGHDLGELNKQLAENEQRVKEFALAAGLDLPVDESRVPAAERDHFAMIVQSFDEGRFGEVRSLARLYQDRYPKSDKLAKTWLLVGKSFSAQKRYAKALGALRRLADLFPKSDQMPEALYEMAIAFYKLGDCTDARILVETVTKRYPDTDFASKSAVLKETMAKEGARCTS